MIVRYIFFGTTTALLYFLLNLLFLKLKISPIVATIISYLLTLPYSFYVNKKIVFITEKKYKIEILKYVSTNITILCICAGIIYLMTYYYKISNEIVLSITPIIIAPILSYLTMKIWVFKK
jgi:putative flippase GtrA